MSTATDYSFVATFPLPLSDMEKHVRTALGKEGFGVLSEIDLQAKLHEKLGVEHLPHKILGACNPKLAHKALQDNPDVALALPCNIVLHEKEPSMTTVSVMLPSVALKPFAGLQVQESACKAQEALQNFFDDLVRHVSSAQNGDGSP